MDTARLITARTVETSSAFLVAQTAHVALRTAVNTMPVCTIAVLVCPEAVNATILRAVDTVGSEFAWRIALVALVASVTSMKTIPFNMVARVILSAAQIIAFLRAV